MGSEQDIQLACNFSLPAAAAGSTPKSLSTASKCKPMHSSACYATSAQPPTDPATQRHQEQLLIREHEMRGGLVHVQPRREQKAQYCAWVVVSCWFDSSAK
jgi:hypothetical protein